VAHVIPQKSGDEAGGKPEQPHGVGKALAADFVPERLRASGLGWYNAKAVGWFGLVAPTGMPSDIVAKLNAAFTKVLKNPEVMQLMASSAPSRHPARRRSSRNI
jgi:hypothetical protein